LADVVFYEVFTEEEEALRRHLPEGVDAVYSPETVQAAGAGRPRAKLVSIRTQSVIPVSWAKELSGILTRSTGTDHLPAFRKWCGLDVPCGYLPDYCSHAVAEHAVLTAMALLRKLKRQMLQFGRFGRDGITGSEAAGRKLVVVGVGRIGSELVRLGRMLEMQVMGVDPEPKLQDLEYVSLEEGVRRAEVLVSAVPLKQDTRGMFNYALLRQAGPGLVFVNVSRGETSPVRDLRRLLDENILGGLGMDVFEAEAALAGSLRDGSPEPVPAAADIRELNGRGEVIFTPHNAFNTRQALERKARLSAEAVMCFLEKGFFPSCAEAP